MDRPVGIIHERMEEERLVKNIYRVKVESNRRRDRPRRKWMDGVKGCTLSDRGLTISEVKKCVKDRESGDILLEGGDVDDPG